MACLRNMNKILTISIAAYNVEKTIGKTLDSLLVGNNDDLNKLDIIIVNDGSKDSTSEVVMNYCTKYPDAIRLVNKQNGGYGSTINTSLEIAKGKYFKLLDGDDQYDTENLTSFLGFLSNTESDIVVSPFIEDNSGERRIIDLHSTIKGFPIAIKDYHETDYYCMHEISVKTEVIKDKIIISENAFYTDCEFTYNCLKYSNTVSKFGKPVYIYNLGVEGQSVSLLGFKKHYKEQLYVIEKICNDYETGLGHNRRNEVIENLIKLYINDSFSKCMMIGKETKNSLKEFDKKLQSMTKVIDPLSAEILKVRTLRKTNFVLYSFLCRLYQIKARKNIYD